MSRARKIALLILVTACGLGALAMPCAEAAERLAEQLTQAVHTSRELSQQAPPYDAMFRRDPMRPLVDAQGEWLTSAGLTSGLSVQGIIWSAERPLVIVDDELYAPGATIGPYTVTEIQEQGIVVHRGETRLFIPLDRGLAPAQERQTASEPTAPAEATPAAEAVPAAIEPPVSVPAELPAAPADTTAPTS